MCFWASPVVKYNYLPPSRRLCNCLGLLVRLSVCLTAGLLDKYRVVHESSPLLIGAVVALCFWVVRQSVRACVSVRLCVRAWVLLAGYLTTHWTEFHQTVFDDIVDVTDELYRSKGRGVRVKVATRSNIWVSYCGGGGVVSGVEASSSLESNDLGTRTGYILAVTWFWIQIHESVGNFNITK